ncbi:MAG: sensor histidine kinase [Spirochaetes bacterium]|nr:sensor histidine kinase [Spirochaetota bacterium]
MFIINVLIASMLIQLIAALYALWLIKITGFKYSWILISSALILMTVRRIIPLYIFFSGSAASYTLNLPVEITGLILSVCMLTGIFGIRFIFDERMQKETEIKKLLAEKELILHEVHHRIKNNMNTIRSMLSLQAEALEDPALACPLKDAEGRVYSMMILYDKLYQSDNILEMPVNSYLSELINQIFVNFPNSSFVQLEKNIGEFIIDFKKLQILGIIINELITNAMKYAFAGRNKGLLSVSVTAESGICSVIVSDNGNGMPESVDFNNPSGFGLGLIKILSEQIKGNIQLDRKNGTRVTLTFRM